MQRLNFFKLIIVLSLGLITSVFAQTNITQVDLSSIDDSKVRVHLKFSDKPQTPQSFAMESPAKVVLDFPDTKVAMDKDKLRPEFNIGVVRKVAIVPAEGKTRVVIDLNESSPYDLELKGNEAFITFQAKIKSNLRSSKAVADQDPFVGKQAAITATAAHKTGYEANDNNYLAKAAFSLLNIDFRRGPQGEGLIIADLSNPNIPIDLSEEGTKIKVKFLDTTIPRFLERKLDVKDFGTPVKFVNIAQVEDSVEVVIQIEGYTENIAYQADKRFTVEVRPLTQLEQERKQKTNPEYKGERLSLNFQDIEVRAVLQLIADFTGLNIVTSDTVRGNVTLRLRNVPWDQALDIILKTKGLSKRKMGNVLLIGPTEELTAREKLELQTNQQVEELAPLRSEYIQVNYAKAADIAALLKDEKNTLLSSRGAASVDDRTNTLLVQDTAQKLDEVRDLVHRLDVPVRQVLIESRVVFANDDFEEALGVKFGAAAKLRPGNEPVAGFAGDRPTSSDLATLTRMPSMTTVAERLLTDLGVTLPGGTTSSGFGLTLASLPGGTILDLELQALEFEGLGKIVASPRLVTSNQQKAYIESGEEIPYLETTSSGAASVAFKKAVLRLDVTPQITPDDRIILDLTVNQDSRGVETAGVPAINTREMHTKVLVDNGETVVLGGIYQQEKNDQIRRVPFFGRLPIVGWMFKSETNLDKRNELMIFVTPKIIQEGMI